ncbi:hypothetical protein [Demequina soli]|uniref:hypothetical protein n=1 Tax=Demequina soli TaxID=1638987 RepID=UPI000781CF5E|nr:hypothetical protein [Demequina soli]
MTRMHARRRRPRRPVWARSPVLGVVLAVLAVAGAAVHHGAAAHPTMPGLPAAVASPATMSAGVDAHPTHPGASCDGCGAAGVGAMVACATAAMLLVMVATPRIRPRARASVAHHRREAPAATPLWMPRTPDLRLLGISRT